MTLQARDNENIEKGRAEGRAESEKNVIQKMYKNGMSIESIAKVLELTVDHVTTLLSKQPIA